MGSAHMGLLSPCHCSLCLAVEAPRAAVLRFYTTCYLWKTCQDRFNRIKSRSKTHMLSLKSSEPLIFRLDMARPAREKCLLGVVAQTVASFLVLGGFPQHASLCMISIPFGEFGFK